MRTTYRRLVPGIGLALAACVADSSGTANLDPDWIHAQIADALQAAPAVVSYDARIFAWTNDGRRVLVRDGQGPYTCVASGSYSLRLGQPPLPHSDPLCADQNAWAFFEAIWAEEDPLTPETPLPSAPGLVWMLEGMNIAGGQVRYGASEDGRLQIGGEASGSNTDAVVNMTPHVMIWPLPIDAGTAELPEVYDVVKPPAQWVMAGGTTVAHMHIHFSAPTFEALTEIPAPSEGTR